MRPTRLLFPWLCLVLVAASGSARAQLRAAELKAAIEKTQISLAEAVDKASAKDERARFVAAELDPNEPAAYRVQVLVEDTLRTILVDARDGSLRKPAAGDLEQVDPKRLDALRRAIDEAKVTPERAIRMATRAVRDGRPYALELRPEGAKPTYEVRVVAGGVLTAVEIDAVRGMVLKAAPIALGKPALTFGFDRDKADRTPPDWRLTQTHPSESAVWQVVADPTAPSPPNVLAVTQTASSERTFNLALATKSSFKDVDLTVQAKALSGNEDQGGGLVWRCQDEDNYYVCRFNPLEGNFRVYRVVKGDRKQLQSASVVTEMGRWYTVRVTMAGDQITCYLDDRKYLEAQDGTFPEAGMIGLWTKADAATAFDDLVVRSDDARRKDKRNLSRARQ